RLRAVVIHEDMFVAAVGEDRAAELANLGRRLDPARRRGVELTELLQLPILRLRQNLDAHVRRHIDRVTPFGLGCLPRLPRFAVIAQASAAGRALRRAVEKDDLAGLLVLADDIRLAAAALHLAKRPQLGWALFQSCLH